MDPIREVAKRKGIPVLEDACQSLGAAYKGVKAGALGEFGAFSFFPSKNLGGFGDGGMVTTNDDALAARLRALAHARRDLALSPQARGRKLPPRRASGRDPAREAAAPRRLGATRGARTRRRSKGCTSRRAGARYEEGGLKFPREAAGREHVFNQFVVRVGKGRRDALKEAPRRAADRKRDLLSGAAAPAGVFRLPRGPAGRLPGGREGGERDARDSRSSPSSRPSRRVRSPRRSPPSRARRRGRVPPAALETRRSVLNPF